MRESHFRHFKFYNSKSDERKLDFSLFHEFGFLWEKCVCGFHSLKFSNVRYEKQNEIKSLTFWSIERKLLFIMIVTFFEQYNNKNRNNKE